MENFELIEKYLGGKLTGPEIEAFEKQMQADPSLQSDVALQQQIIEGIKKARITEIKTMLNQVPVGGSILQSGVAVGKVVTGIVAVGAVVTGSLLYFKPWVKASVPVPKTEIPAVENKPEPITPVDTLSEFKENKAVAAPTMPQSKKEAVAPKAKAVQPKIDVLDPTDELTKTTDEVKSHSENNRARVEASHILTETDASNHKYSFHYQFTQGKLILYGNFDKGLYEVIEVHGDAHSVFLFYKGSYYTLNEKQSSITPLTPIKDQKLIKTLKEYRSR